MKITILGTSSATPTFKRALSGTLVDREAETAYKAFLATPIMHREPIIPISEVPVEWEQVEAWTSYHVSLSAAPRTSRSGPR